MNGKLLKIKKRLAGVPSFKLIEDSDFRYKIEQAGKMLSACNLCPNSCNTDRNCGFYGKCGQTKQALVASFTAHFGEEPGLSGCKGAGTVFFCGCTLSCVFCQNHQISSPGAKGTFTAPAQLAEIFLSLEAKGCHNIELVSPTPHLPAITEALYIAGKQGLNLPIVYNTNGYLTTQALEILDGLVDIYLPDMKYSSDKAAFLYSGINNYVTSNRESVREMYRQQKKTINIEGIIKKGCIVRILLLPNQLEGAEETLVFLSDMPGISLSIMTQYSPQYNAVRYPQLSLTVTKERSDGVLNMASRSDFAEIYSQDTESQKLFLPDFARLSPFENS